LWPRDPQFLHSCMQLQLWRRQPLGPLKFGAANREVAPVNRSVAAVVAAAAAAAAVAAPLHVDEA